MKFEISVALRFLREGRSQTLLILAGIATGVGVIIFLSALITGLQLSIIDRTLGNQAHLVLSPLEEIARPQLDRSQGAILAQVQRPAQRIRNILGWPTLLDALRQRSGVQAATPLVSGSAFALRGTASRSVQLRGIDPESYRGIIDVSAKLVAGDYRVTGRQVLIGTELARELGLGLGDTLRLSAPDDRSDIFTVAGIFDLGNKEINLRWVYMTLRAGQTLMNLAGGVSSIEMKIDEIFSAEVLAQTLSRETGLKVESWMKLNDQLLVGLRSQTSSSVMIQFFVIVAVILGIASVLVVSVVQKGRQIGILRAFGTKRRQILHIFLIQGGLLGGIGSLGGILLGSVLAILFQNLAKNPDGSALFPVALTSSLYLRSVLIALLTGLTGSWLPARRAAKLDPAVAIRYE